MADFVIYFIYSGLFRLILRPVVSFMLPALRRGKKLWMFSGPTHQSEQSCGSYLPRFLLGK